MAKRVIDDDTLKAIADAMRANAVVLRNSEITPLQMPEGITEVYIQGEADGYQKGETAGIAQGKQAQYDEFWDNYQTPNGGQIYSAQYLFGGAGWNDKTFKPKHSMRAITNAANMFNMCSITDVRGILERQGVTFNFANCTNFGHIIAYSRISTFPDVNTTKASNLSTFLNEATSLVSIGLITLKSDGSQAFNNAFNRCFKLEDITFEGVIGNSISFSVSPLSKDSIMGKLITDEEFNALSADVISNNTYIREVNGNDCFYYGGIIPALSGTATGKTLTLNKEAVDAAFPVYAAEEYYDWALTDVEGDWELAVRDLWLGDRVNIGEYMYISFSNTEIIVRKDDDSYVYFEGGDIPANEGSWSLIAHGTDLKNEWGDLVNPEWGELVKSKPNWTINLI